MARPAGAPDAQSLGLSRAVPLHEQGFLEAERAGFEPAMEREPHTRLAGECLQPLGHLSGCGAGRWRVARRASLELAPWVSGAAAVTSSWGIGGVAERSNAAVLKTARGRPGPSGVRIPPPPLQRQIPLGSWRFRWQASRGPVPTSRWGPPEDAGLRGPLAHPLAHDHPAPPLQQSAMGPVSWDSRPRTRCRR